VFWISRLTTAPPVVVLASGPPIDDDRPPGFGRSQVPAREIDRIEQARDSVRAHADKPDPVPEQGAVLGEGYQAVCLPTELVERHFVSWTDPRDERGEHVSVRRHRALHVAARVHEHGKVRRSGKWLRAHDGTVFSVFTYREVVLGQAEDGRPGLVEDRDIDVTLIRLSGKNHRPAHHNSGGDKSPTHQGNPMGAKHDSASRTSTARVLRSRYFRNA
jgi:hypothetical protein